MSNTSKVVLVTIVAAIIVAAIMGISYSNEEIQLRNAIVAKQRDNQSELDNLQKKISQSVQVTDLQVKALEDIIIGNANARNTGKSGAIATWIQEAVPNVDTRTFENLQNIIVGSRDAWTERQKELLDMNRAHDNLITTFPSSLFVGGRGKIDVVIVTSQRAKSDFASGEDNDINLK
jgi:hypothetical protein